MIPAGPVCARGAGRMRGGGGQVGGGGAKQLRRCKVAPELTQGVSEIELKKLVQLDDGRASLWKGRSARGVVYVVVVGGAAARQQGDR